MTSHPLLPILPFNSSETEKSYALLGRALAYATDFENNCRQLAHLSDIRESQSEFSYEVYLLLKAGTLYEKVKSLVVEYKLPEHAENCIHAARKARNTIAHSIALEHDKLLDTESGRLSFRSNILNQMDALIEGNQLVLDITRILKNDQSYTYGSDVVAYFIAVNDWLIGE